MNRNPEWVEYGETWQRFAGQKDVRRWDSDVGGVDLRRPVVQHEDNFGGDDLAKPGVEVEVNGKRYLIGDINPSGGAEAEDVVPLFEGKDVVKRYRVLWDARRSSEDA